MSKNNIDLLSIIVVANVVPESYMVGTNTLSFDSCSYSKASLDPLYSELVALRSNNSSLCQIVAALRDDNARLSDKVTDLQSSLASLQKGLPVLLEEMLSKFKKALHIHTVGQQLESDLTLPSHSTVCKSPLGNTYDESAQSSNSALIGQQSYAPVTRVADAISLHVTSAENCSTQISENITETARCAKSAVNVAVNADFNAAVIAPQPAVNVRHPIARSSVNATKEHNAKENATNSINTMKNGWQNVPLRKKRKVLAIGQCENATLNPVRLKKWVHISSFESSTTADDIIDYVVQNAKIDKKYLVCYGLLKKDSKLEDVKKINFKL